MAEEKEIIFCWIPSHVDIKGNAKRLLLQDVTDYTVPYTDFRKIINDFIKYGWQIRWNAFPRNKLYTILPHVTDKVNINVTTRRDQIVIHRCLIGHSRLTHLHWLNTNTAPICDRCQQPLTIKHILITCNNPAYQRPYQSRNLKHLFQNVPTATILQYHLGYYYDI